MVAKTLEMPDGAVIQHFSAGTEHIDFATLNEGAKVYELAFGAYVRSQPVRITHDHTLVPGLAAQQGDVWVGRVVFERIYQREALTVELLFAPSGQDHLGTNSWDLLKSSRRIKPSVMYTKAGVGSRLRDLHVSPAYGLYLFETDLTRQFDAPCNVKCGFTGGSGLRDQRVNLNKDLLFTQDGAVHWDFFNFD